MAIYLFGAKIALEEQSTIPKIEKLGKETQRIIHLIAITLKQERFKLLDQIK